MRLSQDEEGNKELSRSVPLVPYSVALWSTVSGDAACECEQPAPFPVVFLVVIAPRARCVLLRCGSRDFRLAPVVEWVFLQITLFCRICLGVKTQKTRDTLCPLFTSLQTYEVKLSDGREGESHLAGCRFNNV